MCETGIYLVEHFLSRLLALPLSIVPASAVSTTYTAPNEGAEVFDGPGSSVQARAQDTMSGSLYSLAMDAPITAGDTLNEGSFADGIDADPNDTLTVDILVTGRIMEPLYQRVSGRLRQEQVSNSI